MGLEIDTLIFKDNICDKSIASLSLYKSLEILSVNNTFYFRMTNSIYSKNIYLTSNYVNNTAYIEIRNITVDSKDIKYYDFVKVKPNE